jgi:hypothetical protein
MLLEVKGVIEILVIFSESRIFLIWKDQKPAVDINELKLAITGLD